LMEIAIGRIFEFFEREQIMIFRRIQSLC
jgi:hypothetical protein